MNQYTKFNGTSSDPNGYKDTTRMVTGRKGVKWGEEG